MAANNLSEIIERVIHDHTPHDERDVRAATSPYQNDFPYDRDEEAQVARRDFCKFLGLTSGALFLGAAGFATKAVIDSNNAPEYVAAQIEGAAALEPGSSLNFRYPTVKDSAILIRDKAGNYFAYGQKCTHLACPVYYAPEHHRLECPCHEGAFDVASGRVLYGPPPRPLDLIQIEVRDGEVWATSRRAGRNEQQERGI